MQRRHLANELAERVPVVRSDATTTPAAARAVRRRRDAGVLRQIAPGAHVPTDVWRTLRPAERHVVQVLASAPRGHAGWMTCRRSAAAVHGLPSLGPWPDRVHVLDNTRRTARTNATFVVHGSLVPAEPDATVRAATGLLVVDPVRTAADIARTGSFRQAVLALDRVLHDGAAREDVARTIDALGPHGREKGTLALDFATTDSDSAGESLARVVFRELGFPSPVLQQSFDVDGAEYRVDFWFPDQGVVIEFDGEAKYADPAFLRGRTATRVVIDEKWREDALRSLPGVTGLGRIGWASLFRPHEVLGTLGRAGLTPMRSR